jgi:hypothetical protein
MQSVRDDRDQYSHDAIRAKARRAIAREEAARRKGEGFAASLKNAKAVAYTWSSRNVADSVLIDVDDVAGLDSEDSSMDSGMGAANPAGTLAEGKATRGYLKIEARSNVIAGPIPTLHFHDAGMKGSKADAQLVAMVMTG